MKKRYGLASRKYFNGQVGRTWSSHFLRSEQPIVCAIMLKKNRTVFTSILAKVVDQVFLLHQLIASIIIIYKYHRELFVTVINMPLVSVTIDVRQTISVYITSYTHDP